MSSDPKPASEPEPQEAAAKLPLEVRILLPIANYTLTTVCPACGTSLFRHACKARCPQCGFAWDCSEL